MKEQLKKMGSFEYYQTSFSYTLQETGEEKFVGVPEQGGRDLISTDPLSPGTVYTAGVTSDGTVGLYRLEVSVSSGTGKLKMAGGISGAMKESVQRAFSYVQAKKAELGIARDLETSDLHVEVIDLLGNRVEAEVGVAFFVACLFRASESACQPCAARLGRHERPRKHQASPVPHGAASGGEGQWRKARAHSDREQAKLPGCERRHHGARRSDLLRRPQDGRHESARNYLMCRDAYCTDGHRMVVVRFEGLDTC